MGTVDQPERSDSFQPGQTFGKFYLVQVIGEGGTSRIFKALQQPISRLVALKIPTFAGGGGILTPDEFLSEATLMARLDHPNIVRIHDFGVEEGRAFICMEHVDGWNLLDLIERHHPLPVSAVLAIALQVLEALMHAHSREVLHQDLSPANVLVSRSGTVKLLDFGMAGKDRASSDGKVVGTPAALSPEHLAGGPCTPRSDLFSFGSLLYFLGRCEPLFDPGEDHARLEEAFREIERARWQPPLERLRTLPASLSRLVRSALEGGDPEAMLREMRDLWDQCGGGARPEDALRRELLEGTAAGAREEPASPREVREAYLRLRAGDRHREAMSLLERALRRFPDDPSLRELASAPARAKSAPVTMEVESPAGGPAGAPALPSRRLGWAAAAVAALALIAGGLALLAHRAGPAAGTATVTAGSVPIARPDRAPEAVPSLQASRPESPPSRGDRAAGVPAPAAPLPTTAGITRVSLTRAAPAPVRHPAARPPALRVAGPQGARILVNDTLALEAPSPLEGWPLPAGLLNLVVTHPDLAQPISSSLYAAADTVYVLDLQADGGFSVSRRGR